MKTAIILGTRPEIIKMSPLIRLFEKRSADFFILHSNQHYSPNMDKVFFEELDLPSPKYNLHIGSASHAEQTGRMLIEIEKVLLKEKPDIVLVQGDTNTVLAGALAAAKLQIKVGHVEAGLRSYFRQMPEEINRIMADHLSDYLFVPTKRARDILLSEGITKKQVFLTGNTVVDAVFQNAQIAEKRSNVLKEKCLDAGSFFLLTAHRQENVDEKDRLDGILKGMHLLHKKYGLPVIYPIHPRTKKRIAEFGIEVFDALELIEPVSYLDFLQLQSAAKLILTDSGGVQEEACILQVPCVTLRENTERPETIEVGANLLAGTDKDKILSCATEMLLRERIWQNPFGDGDASEKIWSSIQISF
jgi:UDP-N-acetylglucosamine 2-epimerase (non-hydrolysing)